LGRRSESSYAKESGFGHEEWNFNKDFAIDGLVHGYHYYKPAEKKRGQPFTLFFVTYSLHRWHLVGVYRDAKHSDDGAPTTPAILRKKVQSLRALGGDLGEEWATMTDAQMLKRLGTDAAHCRWSVDVNDIVVPSTAPEISASVEFENDFRGNFHETTATLVSASDARILESLVGKDAVTRGRISVNSEIGPELPDLDDGALEGKQRLVSHLKRERSAKLVKTKKREVYDATGKLACEVCGFDFYEKYGSLGDRYCEVHHLKRLSDVQEGTVKTKLADLAIVCSNCHRMIHCGEPMPTLQKLTSIMMEVKDQR
jgi:hypothetical protein